MLHFLLPDLFVSSEGFDKAVDHDKQNVDTERLMHARRLLSCFMLRRTKEVARLPSLRPSGRRTDASRRRCAHSMSRALCVIPCCERCVYSTMEATDTWSPR